jgi:hypothetical protein
MRYGQWKRLVLTMLSGAVLFQAPGCEQAAIGLSTLASLVTAGGVIYLVTKVID